MTEPMREPSDKHTTIILTDKEKKERHLPQDKMHVLRFLFNNKMNKATDPEPFAVHTDLLDKLREDSIGMPWIVPEYGVNMHIRGKYDNPEDEVQSLLDLQKEFTVGEIVDTIRYSSDNVWGIIDVFPKFQASVERGYFPQLVSPTLNIIEKDSESGVVLDAQFINLQSVPKSGYPTHLTQVQGICKADMIECMPELRLQGAAGHTSSTNIVSVSKGKSGTSKSMSETETSESTETTETTEGEATEMPKVEELVKAVEELQAKAVATDEKLVAVEEVIVEVAVEAEGVDEAKIEEMLPDTGEGAGEEGEETLEEEVIEGASKKSKKLRRIGGASGNRQAVILQKQIDELNKKDAIQSRTLRTYERESKEAKNALKKQHAESIVERKTRDSDPTVAEKAIMIKEWSEKSLEILETVDNELKAAFPESTKESTIHGSYGKYVPDLTVKNTSSHPKNSSVTLEAAQ